MVDRIDRLADTLQLARRTRRIALQSIVAGMGLVPSATAHQHLLEVQRFLDGELLPHERTEETDLYPAVAPYLGGEETTAAARHQHAEVAHLVLQLNAMIGDLDPAGPNPDDLPGLRRVLYGLHAVLALHRADEEERLSSIVDAPGLTSSPP